MHSLRIHIADDNKGQIVRNVARFVIIHHLLLRELVINFQLADHRQAIRMLLISGLKGELTRHAIGIIEAHRKFPPDYFLLLDVFIRRQRRVHHCVGQNVERGRHAILRNIDPENGAVERGEGVDITAGILDALRDSVGCARLRSLEEHVLENVRKAGAEMFGFIDAAGATPCLHARYGCAAILLHDNRKTVGQHPFLRRDRRKGDRRRIFPRCGLQMSIS